MEYLSEPAKNPTAQPNPRNVLVVSAVTNWIDGDTFAVGGIVLNEKGTILGQFYGRSPLPADSTLELWLVTNVLPDLDPETHASLRELRVAFWTWFRKHHDRADVFVDAGWPGTVGLLHAYLANGLRSRDRSAPYPLHDIGTVLWTLGIDIDDDRRDYVEDILRGRRPSRYHPTDNAWVSGLTLLRATGRLPRRVTLGNETLTQRTARRIGEITAEESVNEQDRSRTFDLSDLPERLILVADSGGSECWVDDYPYFANHEAHTRFVARLQEIARTLDPDVVVIPGHGRYRFLWGASLKYRQKWLEHDKPIETES